MDGFRRIWAWIVKAAKAIDAIAMDWLFPEGDAEEGENRRPPWWL